VILAKLIRGLDTLLRCYRHIYEFSQDKDCLLRLAIAASDRDLTLSDGARIAQGELIGEIHLWNEHIPAIPRSGPDLAWGRTVRHQLARSWAELAAYIEAAPDFQPIRAFRGEMAFVNAEGLGQAITLAQRWGFEFVKPDQPAGSWRRLGAFWRNLYTLALIWAFNPVSLRAKNPRGVQRGQFWISRAALLRKYGPRQQSVL